MPTAQAAAIDDRPEEENKPKRLTMNIAADVYAVLVKLVKKRGMTITDGIRRAILVWKFLEDEQDKGNRLAVLEERDGKTLTREVVLLG